MGRMQSESLHTEAEWKDILEGATAEEAVEKTGLSLPVVRRIARGLGISLRRRLWTDGRSPDEIRRICSCYPVRTAAGMLGVSTSTVSSERRRLGIRTWHRKKSGMAASKRALLLYLSRTFTYDSIAGLLGTSRQYVQQECAAAERNGDEIDPGWRLRDDEVHGKEDCR